MKHIFLTDNSQLKRIIFWEPCISPHKTDFLHALSIALPDIEIICCADQGLPIERKALGWIASLSDRVATIISPDAVHVENIVFEDITHTFHVFSGTRHFRTLILGLKAVKSCGACFAMMAEPRAFEGWKGVLRFLQSWLTEGWLRKNCAFVLAIGQNGSPWFKSVGYEPKKIFPFAYFVAPPKLIQNTLGTNLELSSPSFIRIGYVGRMIAMKGIFDLVRATKYLRKPAHLTFVGAGLDKQKLQKICLKYKVSAEFCGVLPNRKIGQLLEKIDVLVLASISKDGWGVVVSEALMSGTAVVATNEVGASLMLDHKLFGYKVPAQSPAEIAKALEKHIASEAFTNQNRLARQILARARLSPEVGARYFSEILRFRFGEGVCPKPFYLNEN